MSKLQNFGEYLRELRKKKELPLRTVAAYLDIDQAILSKIERGQRRANREQVLNLAKYYTIDENELLKLWLAEKLVYELKDEEFGLEALKVAEEQVKYQAYKQIDRKAIIQQIKDYLKKDGRVAKAWLFGSFARGDDDYKSDIDIMVEFKTEKKYSLFDFLEIQDKLENMIKRKIDLVENGLIKPFAWENVKKDLRPIL